MPVHRNIVQVELNACPPKHIAGGIESLPDLSGWPVRGQVVLND
jgi:hypothetical protein